MIMGDVFNLNKNYGVEGRNLQEALDDVVSESIDQSLEQRFDLLAQQFVAFAFHIIDRQKRTGEKICDAEQVWQEESMKQLRMISQVWAMAKKNGRIGSTPNKNFESQTIDEIKKMRSTVGDVVRKIPIAPKDGTTSEVAV